jgi:tRNA (guanine-N7-)-methyltransferase
MEKAYRRLKSYVLREGRVTKRQQRALDELWDKYVINPSSSAAFSACFERGLHTLEIGFGMGASLRELAQQQPDKQFLGVEVHRPGVASLLADLEEYHINNVKIICHDAVEVLEQLVPDNSLQRVLIFFPDPWHKKKHHKRRLVQISLVERIYNKLQAGGVLHLATDWVPYAEHMEAVMSQLDGFKRLADDADPRPETKFEHRGLRLGHVVNDLIFEKI